MTIAQQHLENTRVLGASRLISPVRLKEVLPLPDSCADAVRVGRLNVERILRGDDSRFLVIVGPCSIHDPAAALEYARRLVKVRTEVSASVNVVMRVYFEKPRTTIGWKGLINDPDLDESCDLEKGLRLARGLMLEIAALGLPMATEFLDPIVPQYLGDLVAWAAVGARTTESQTHREMASGLSMPVGFKNGTDGRIQTAIDAMVSARHPHSFLGIDQSGLTSVIKTSGNPDTHLVLRGGLQGPNYEAAQIADAVGLLVRNDLPPRVMIDCSHANSNKDPRRQVEVWNTVVGQKAAGVPGILGAMVESFLSAGNQKPGPRESLTYGVSITDACLGWEETETLLREAGRLLDASRAGSIAS